MDDIKYKRCTGLTNITYKVKTNKFDLKPVILREFCKNENLDHFISKSDENSVFNYLSKINLGPKNLG